MNRRAVLAALPVLLLLSGCKDDPTTDTKCQTTVATGISSDGKVVVLPVTTCFDIPVPEPEQTRRAEAQWTPTPGAFRNGD